MTMRSTTLFLCGCLMATPSHAFDKVYFAGTSPYVDGSGRLIFDGVRGTGDGHSLLDAFKFIYAFDIGTLDFRFKSLVAYDKVGIFNDWLMARDVAVAQPPFTIGSTTYPSGVTHRLTGTAQVPIHAVYRLGVGHVMSWLVKNQSNTYRFRFTGPDTDVNFVGSPNTGLITAPSRILRAGTYHLTITPIGATDLSVDLRSFNANNRKLSRLTSGTYVSDHFESNLHDYSKYAVSLAKGQILKMPAGGSDIEMKVVDKYGAVRDDVRGLPLNFAPWVSGDFRVFIFNAKGWGGSYYGTATIETISGRPAEATPPAADGGPTLPAGASAAR